jgi:hypothetical protein
VTVKLLCKHWERKRSYTILALYTQYYIQQIARTYHNAYDPCQTDWLKTVEIEHSVFLLKTKTCILTFNKMLDYRNINPRIGIKLIHKITGSLDFFHCQVFLGIKTRRFGNWICFRPQVKGEKTPTQLGPSERANLNHSLTTGPNWVGVFSPSSLVSHPSPEDRNRFSFRNVVFLLPKTPDDGKSRKSTAILCDIHHR